jgi:hypothetical protein
MVVICQYCNKEYSSLSSRSNHIKRIHNSEVFQKTTTSIPKIHSNVFQSIPNVLSKGIQEEKEIIDVVTCKFCHKKYSSRQNRWKHEKICKEKCKENEIENKDEIIQILKESILEIKKNQEEQMEQFKKECLKAMKIHPRTLQKINKQLNNFGTINNINLIGLGKEGFEEVLTDKQKLYVLNGCHNAPCLMTEMIYTKPEFEKYRNVYITNLSNDIGYIFDENKKQYIVKSKSKILNQYSNERLWNIEAFYDDLKDKLDAFTIKKIENLINNYFNDEAYNSKIKKELLISLYNNKVNVKGIYEKVNEIEI